MKTVGEATGHGTIRRQIIALLDAGPCGVRELSQELHVSEREIYAHLAHIERSLKAEGRRLSIEPAVCLSCGFVFTERRRPAPPGHCPRCRRTHIRRPEFHIR